MELSVNRFDRVIDATALNEDGQSVLDAVDVEHKDVRTAIETLTTSEACRQYVRPDSYVSIGVVSEDKQQGTNLMSQGQQVVDNLACSGHCQSVDAETREAAQRVHMGVGKYLAARRLVELDGELTLEECAGMTMRELRDRILELGGEVDRGGECNDPVAQCEQQGHRQHSKQDACDANGSQRRRFE